jgi:hypothetical protein
VPSSLIVPARDFTPELLDAGDRYLREIGDAVTAADPEARVEPRSRLLCAALGLLAEITLQALGGGDHPGIGSAFHDGAASGPKPRASGVGAAAAMLSLLTKIDDQVIDALAFHGGAGADRAAVEAKTRAFLAPTLASLRAARPANDEPRCLLAADLGARLRALTGDPARLDRLLAAIAHGWEVQVSAVAVLTRDPRAIDRAEIAAVTRAISGAWLLMIAMVGTLPASAARALDAAEEEAFFDWGWAIQRADALADLDKDLADGHLSSWAARLVWERSPRAFEAAIARGDHAAVYALARAHGVGSDALPTPAEAAALRASLPALGEVPALLAWIHGYLVRRYEIHPLAGGSTQNHLSTEARLFPCSAR